MGSLGIIISDIAEETRINRIVINKIYNIVLV